MRFYKTKKLIFYYNMKELYNLFLFIAICFVIYLVFRNFNYNPMLIEGMTDASGNTVTVNAPANGVAGNAASYAAALKAATIKMQDTFLISKYRSDYESSILNLDDLINNLMLNTALNVNQSNPGEAIEKLAKMQQAKVALNSVMKFVDSQ
jgi:hypothetical protein